MGARAQFLFVSKTDELVAASCDSGCASLDGTLADLVSTVCSLCRQMATPQRAVLCAAALARCFDAYRLHSVALRSALEYAVRAAVDALLECPLAAFPDWLHWLQSRPRTRAGESRSWTLIVVGLCSLLRDATEPGPLNPAVLQRHEVCCLVFELLQWVAAYGTASERAVLRGAMADLDTRVALYPRSYLPHAPLFRAMTLQVVQTLLATEDECAAAAVTLVEE